MNKAGFGIFEKVKIQMINLSTILIHINTPGIEKCFLGRGHFYNKLRKGVNTIYQEVCTLSVLRRF